MLTKDEARKPPKEIEDKKNVKEKTLWIENSDYTKQTQKVRIANFISRLIWIFIVLASETHQGIRKEEGKKNISHFQD